MKLFCSDKFIKQISDEKLSDVKNLLYTIAPAIKKEHVYTVLGKYRNKKMAGAKNIWKFNADSSFRIIWTFGKFLNGTRQSESDDVFLLSFSNHDQQGRVASELSKDINRQNFYEIKEKTKNRPNNNLQCYVRLTNDQESYIRSELPLLISGGAGNGKTLVALNKLKVLQESYPKATIGYFTFTKGLKEKAKEEYQKFNGTEEHNNFYALNEYLRELLKLDPIKFIQFYQFRQWYKKFIQTKYSFDAIDVWVEIRGIIKGYMGSEWKRIFSFDMHMLKEKSIKYLIINKFIYYPYKSNKKELACYGLSEKAITSQINKITKDTSLSEDDRANILNDIKAITDYQEVSQNKKLIEKFDYLSLKDDTSQYIQEERLGIYMIAKLYQQWLDEHSFYDDNDLARGLIINTKKHAKFDFLVVDEIQDLSEIQIYAITRLLNNFRNIVLCGDVHQIIQPTIFTTSRINQLFSKDISINYLRVNHRSQGEIVTFTNELAKLRRDHIGSRKKESEIREEAVWKDVAPFHLNLTKQNIKEALPIIASLADVALVVSNEEEKIKLLKNYNENKPIANIYTVNEVKGLEWRYIFIYNLIGSNLLFWKGIFTSDVKHQGRYRYYFNLLYVACTRAKDRICFCEDINLHKIDEMNNLFRNTIKVKTFDPIKLDLLKGKDELEKWLLNAKRLEKQEVYDRAALYYLNANMESDAKRCEALDDIQKNKEDQGIKSLYNLGEYELSYINAKLYKKKKIRFFSSLMKDKFTIDSFEKEYGIKYITSIYSNKIRNTFEREMLESRYLIPKAKKTEKTYKKLTNDIDKFIGGMENG